YATAEAFALDLNRYLAGEPIEARPIGAAARFARRVRRSPLVAAALVVAVAALVAGSVGVKLALRSRAEQEAQAREADKARARQEAQALLGKASTALRRGELDGGIAAASEAIGKDPSYADAWDLRGSMLSR